MKRESARDIIWHMKNLMMQPKKEKNIKLIYESLFITIVETQNS